MINTDLLELKYITGTYRYAEEYPTDKDLLWDIVSIGKTTMAEDSIDWIDNEDKVRLLDILENGEYIKRKNNRITVLKTYWDD